METFEWYSCTGRCLSYGLSWFGGFRAFCIWFLPVRFVSGSLVILCLVSVSVRCRVG